MKLTTKWNKHSDKIRIQGKELNVGIKSIKEKNDWRDLGFKISQFCKSEKIKGLTITDVDLNSNEFLEGLYLGEYHFSMKKINKNKNVEFTFNPKEDVNTFDFIDFTSKIREKIMAQNLTKDIVNTPPNISNSKYIVKKVKKIFKNIDVKVYSEKELNKLNMNGHLAVNAASENKAVVIKLTYTPKKYDKHHVYVGKGLTYDSGGYSIKPTNSMLSMQADKSGAMVLLGFMSYVENNGANQKITAYLSIAENMINSKGFRPGDILTMKNGMTVNIKNTDAEGRLVLFDGLCLAQEENKDISTITTIATLTGAAVYQFGDEVAALVSFNNKLKKKIKKAGKKTGEIFMNAEFHKYMLDGVDDKVADLSNIGTPNMGCQKAGLFLSKAITKKNKSKFIHWDIAGPSWIEKPFGTNTIGGTGFGVRTLIKLYCE